MNDNLPPGCTDADIERDANPLYPALWCPQCEERIDIDDAYDPRDYRIDAAAVTDTVETLCRQCAESPVQCVVCKRVFPWITTNGKGECADCELEHEDEIKVKS